MKVAELFATFDLRPNRRSIAEMNRTFRTMRGAAMGLGAFFAGGALARGLIGFNARMEDAKLNFASMIALAKQTSVTDQLEVANTLYESIRKKAAEVAGTTEDHVRAAQMLIFPLSKAGLSMEEIRDLSVNAVVAAKGIGITTPQASIRDVQQFLAGRFTSTDLFLNSLFGFPDEEKRKQIKSGTVQDRVKRIREALNQPQIQEAARLQAQTFSGQMDKMKEAVVQFLGRIGLPLFKALTSALQRANKWLEANRAAVEKFAEKLGGALVSAFGMVARAFEFLVEHGELAKAMFKGLAFVVGMIVAQWVKNWILFAAPWLRIWLIITVLVRVFEFLRDKIGVVGALVVTAFGAALVLKFNAVTGAIGRMAGAMLGYAGATRAAAAAQVGLMRSQGMASALQQASQFAVPGARGAKQFANKGGGGGGGGGLGALGALGALLRFIPPIAAAEAVSELTGGSFSDDSIFMRRLRGESMESIKGSLAQGKAEGAVTQNINAPLTVNITGVKDADEAVKALQDEHQKQMRRLQYATAGGAR